MPRNDTVDQLTSPDRFVIPLPSIDEAQQTAEHDVTRSTTPAPSHEASPTADDQTGGPMLIDYLSRLARFEPRVRRISLSRRRNLPDTTPFVRSASGVASPNESPTPVDQAQGHPHGHGSDRELLQDVPRITQSTQGQQQQRARGGYTLLDFERMLLSPFRRLAASTASHDNDHDYGSSGGLDIDLSGALDDLSIVDHDSKADGAFVMPKNKGKGLLLDVWTHEQLIDMLKQAGVLRALAQKGFHDISLIFDTSDPLQHRLSCVDSCLFSPSLGLGSQDRFLIDVYLKKRETFNPSEMVCYQLMQRLLKFGSWEALHEATGELRAPYVGLEGVRDVAQFFDAHFAQASKYTKLGEPVWFVTELAWMQMHNPLVESTRPLLPGQRFPGLGIGRTIGECMEKMAVQSAKTDALLNFPFHYHNAIMYATRGYKHLDPVYEAYVSWMTEQLKPFEDDHGFAFVAWAVVSGHLRRVVEARDDAGQWEQLSNRMERWSSSEQVFPTGEAPRRFVESSAHRALYQKYKDIFDRDGGANLQGVHVAAVASDPREKRARLVIDLEGAPELWKYSKIWHNRDPETGEFR